MYNSQAISDTTMILLDEGIQKHPTLIKADSYGHTAAGTVWINGRKWTEYRGSNAVLATTMPDGVQVIIRDIGRRILRCDPIRCPCASADRPGRPELAALRTLVSRAANS